MQAGKTVGCLSGNSRHGTDPFHILRLTSALHTRCLSAQFTSTPKVLSAENSKFRRENFKESCLLEQRVTGVISLSEFELSKLKVYKVERSIYPSIFRIKQRVQPLCLDLFILREIDWKGRVQV